MIKTKWTEKLIISELQGLHSEGCDLSYTTLRQTNYSLVRAMERHMGYKQAIASAGLDYNKIKRSGTWSKERVIKELRYLFGTEQDINAWHLRQHNPSLCNAVYTHFGNMEEACFEAGIIYQCIRKR
ncbi:hypothetical protein COM46_08585 [Bacillus pseudomycoides]|uniref:hypothetical protein n=1 Tax=Bacillus pseudomycoides TaxID=64104 RepID=UPI000BF4584B|nr:hypothetical protein [Bacillus pseudomycoides]PGD77083.1 hypothetical protein COM46_08585 [Bacillus pseudomycoides]